MLLTLDHKDMINDDKYSVFKNEIKDLLQNKFKI